MVRNKARCGQIFATVDKINNAAIQDNKVISVEKNVVDVMVQINQFAGTFSFEGGFFVF